MAQAVATRNKVVELKEAGLGPATIGRELDISRQRAWSVIHAKKRGANNMLTRGEVAKLLGVNVDTVWKWSKKGILRAYQLTPGGQRRYRLEDIEAFIKNGGDMKTTIQLQSDQLSKEDVRALLQAIRLCEVATFPDKEIRVLVDVPELTTAETEEILTSIKPPYKYGFTLRR
jgi:excisionase family DNA binding protein